MKRWAALCALLSLTVATGAAAEDMGVIVAGSGGCYGPVMAFAKSRGFDIFRVTFARNPTDEPGDIVECAVAPCSGRLLLKSPGAGTAEAQIERFLKQPHKDGSRAAYVAGCLESREVIADLAPEDRKVMRNSGEVLK